MKNTNSRKLYLKTIYKLEKENSVVRSIDLAKELQYSKSSISRAIGVLKEAKLIIHPRYGDITLTPKGRKLAIEIHTTQYLITSFLMVTLDIDEQTAEENAYKIGYIVSTKVITAIRTYLSKG